MDAQGWSLLQGSDRGVVAEHIDDGKYKNIKFNGGSLETLKRMVDQGYGYTLLPELAYLEADVNQKKEF